MKACALVLAVAACGDNARAADPLAYDWDDRRVLCSQPIDDYEVPLDFGRIDFELSTAAKNGYVAIMHAHVPTETIALATLDHVFELADHYDLTYFTFRDLVPSATPVAGLAFAFDDDSPDQWMLARDILTAHGAKITFFVTRWTTMTDAQHAEIATLHGDGHDVEPHTVNHLHGADYVAQYGLDAYMADEVLPSFTVLTEAGYPTAAAFAYPFGDHTPEMDAAILPYVDTVRTTPGPCPNY